MSFSGVATRRGFIQRRSARIAWRASEATM
jgi:hypothetical protein